MTIKTWPKAEQPREKLLEKGAEHLSSAELLAIFLRVGIKGKSALDLARDLLSRFGSLKQLMQASLHDFSQAPGLGAAKFVQLQAALELSRRCLLEDMQHHDVLNNPTQTRHYLLSKLSNRSREIFACLFLNNQNKLIAYDEMFQGSVHQADIYPREILKAALKHNATSIIVAHNHPSGDATPSQSDLHLTQSLKNALNMIDVDLLDHFVIGRNHAVSLAERGGV